LKNPVFWIFSILLFSCWSWYTGFCMMARSYFHSKKSFTKQVWTCLNLFKLDFFLSAVVRGLIFLSGSIVVVSLKANNFYRFHWFMLIFQRYWFFIFSF
jgi:hypothetical protein